MGFLTSFDAIRNRLAQHRAAGNALCALIPVLAVAAMPPTASAAPASPLCRQIDYLLHGAGPHLGKIPAGKLTQDKYGMKVFETPFNLQAGYACPLQRSFDVSAVDCSVVAGTKPLRGQLGACLTSGGPWQTTPGKLHAVATVARRRGVFRTQNRTGAAFRVRIRRPRTSPSLPSSENDPA